MKARGALSYTTAIGRLLTRMISTWEAGSEYAVSRRANHEVLRKKGGEASTMPGVVICSVRGAMKAQCSQPVMVNPGPILALLLMLRNRAPRRDRVRWRELSLPAGCVLAARYTSR